MLPELERKGKMVRQGRLNIYRNITKEDDRYIFFSGFSIKDERQKLKKEPFGYVNGTFLGFMDQCRLVKEF
jgi:hypothetical protein